MITRRQWLICLEATAEELENARYGWKSPVNKANSRKKATCVTYISRALQNAGLLPEGKYIHLNNGRLAGTGLSYIKAHPEIYEIKWVRASPQRLGSGLQVGDICLYTVPHIQAYSGKNSKGTPLWFSLERGSGGIGKPVKLTRNGVFSFYSKREIACIIRIKFKDSAPKTATNASVAVTKPVVVRWKLKTAMNMRDTANGKQVICRIPQGAVLTQQAKTGYWIKTTYCGITGWVCCGTTKYASKL